VRVIKKSGKWTPAIQNGNPVRSYKKQPIIFRIDEG
jgi:periplasmic protein TonB